MNIDIEYLDSNLTNLNSHKFYYPSPWDSREAFKILKKCSNPAEISIDNSDMINKESGMYTDEFRLWCDENIHHPWTSLVYGASRVIAFYLTNNDEIILFKLTWT